MTDLLQLADRVDKLENMPAKTIRLSIADIAALSAQIIDKADNGTKLFSITKNYPRGGDTVAYGFCFGIGLIGAFCVAASVTKVVSFLI